MLGEFFGAASVILICFAPSYVDYRYFEWSVGIFEN